MTNRLAVEPSTLPCLVCQQPNPRGARVCAACGTHLPHSENPKEINDIPDVTADETVLGHRTLLNAVALDGDETLLESGPAIPEGGHTLLGVPRPVLPAERLGWAGPTVLDGVRGGPPEGHAPAEASFTPVGGHPALPASVGAEAIELAEDPDRPLPAVTVPARPRLTPPRPPVARPPSRGRQLALLVGTALLAALGTVWALSWMDDGFRAELVGDLAVTRTSSGYDVQVGVRTSGPASVQHPGGRALVDGEAALRFELEDARIQLGDNPVTLQVHYTQGVRTLTLHVMVYYKLLPEAPGPGGAPRARLEVLPGWRMFLETPGEVVVRQPGVFALQLAPSNTPTVPVRFALESPEGARFTFDEALRPQAPR